MEVAPSHPPTTNEPFTTTDRPIVVTDRRHAARLAALRSVVMDSLEKLNRCLEFFAINSRVSFYNFSLMRDSSVGQVMTTAAGEMSEEIYGGICVLIQ